MKKVLFAVIVCALFYAVNVEAKEYNLNQTKACQDGALCDLDGNLLTGLVKEYDNNENLKSETTFFNGKKNGDFRTYYTNGNLKSEGRYVYGARVGKTRKYYESRALQAELVYKNGQKNGTSKIYYEDGELKAEILFKNGKAISGDMYDKEGNKIKMTNAHLHTVDKGKLPNPETKQEDE